MIRALSGKTDDSGLNGYLPIKPKAWKIGKSNLYGSEKIPGISEVKEAQLISVLTRIKSSEVRIVMVDSPYYSRTNQDDEAIVRIKEICDSLEVPFIDNTHLDGFFGNKEMFSDNVHLNTLGSEQYTLRFIEQSKNYFNEQTNNP